MRLGVSMYLDLPYARELGHVVEAAGVVTPAGVMEGHDVPACVLTSVIYWLQKEKGADHSLAMLDGLRKKSLEGGEYCCNEGCEVVGHVKDFKVCPQCKTARYCGAACQKEHWNAGGHKDACGTFGAFSFW
jgi:hypothetical protein